MNKFKKSSKRNKLFLVVALGIIIFVQCNWFDEDEVYDPHEHPLIQVGDTLVFEGLKDIDSLITLEANVYGPHKKEETYDEEAYWCEIRRLNCIRKDTCLVLRIKINSASYILYYNYPFSITPAPYADAEILSESSGEDYTLDIGKYGLSDLYFIEFTSPVDYLFKEVKTVLYSRTYGFVQYVNFRDEVYTLSEESLEMLMVRE